MCGCQEQTLNPNQILRPRDFLSAPEFINPRSEFGYIGQFSTTVPADKNIYLAEAQQNTTLTYAPDGQTDTAPENAPVKALEGIIHGGELLDIYATGTVRHIPNPSIEIGAKGWDITIVAGPALGLEAVQGPIGSLVGLFNNQREPFVIGNRRQIEVPRGANSLYLAVLDYPGASSNNEGEFQVSIDVIRR